MNAQEKKTLAKEIQILSRTISAEHRRYHALLKATKAAHQAVVAARTAVMEPLHQRISKLKSLLER